MIRGRRCRPALVLLVLRPVSWRLGPRKHIEISSDHSVVNLAVFGGGKAERPLRVRIGSDQIHRPGIERPEALSQRMIELCELCLRFCAKKRIFRPCGRMRPCRIFFAASGSGCQPLAVRRVGDDKSVLLGMGERADRADLKMNQIGDTGKLCVFSGCGDSVRIDVKKVSPGSDWSRTAR